MNQTIRVAVVQEPPVFLNLIESLARAEQLIAQAAAEGAKVIAFPETWLPGYPLWLDFAPEAGLWDHPPAKALFRVLSEQSLVKNSPECRRLIRVAAQHKVHVVMGADERDGATIYNSIFMFKPDGSEPFVHRKLVPTYTERLVWGMGDGAGLGVVDTTFGPLGALVCWEHWMPLLRAAMHAKRETIHVAQWPMVKDPLHLIASRHYAFEGQCYVLAVGTALRRDDVLAGYDSIPDAPPEGMALLESMPKVDWIHRGGSAIIAPDTSYILEPVNDQTGVFYADLDRAAITEGALTMDTDGHYSRPDIFQLSVDQSPRSNVAFKS